MKNIKLVKLGIFLFLFMGIISCRDEDIVIDTKPVGAFSYTYKLANNNTAVITTFTDLSFDQNGSIVSWLWDFGDGTTSTEKSPVHTYALGNYTVTLKVTDSKGNVNVNEFSKVLDFTVIVEPTRLWSFDLPVKTDYSSPAIADDGTVYIGCNFPDALRLTLSNGSTPNNFFAVNPNGTLKWGASITEGATFNKVDAIESSPSISSDGSVYIGGHFGRRLYKLNPANGIFTTIALGSRIRHAAPTFATNGTVYIGTRNNGSKGVRSLTADLATQNWLFASGIDFNSTATIGADGTIYIGANNGFLYAINPDGTEKWSSNFGTSTATTPAIGPDGTIYFAGEGNKANPTFKGVLTAYNPTNGSVKWTVGLTEKVNHGGPAVAADGTIYVGGHEKKMVAYNPANGSEKWSYTVDSPIEVVPAIDNDGNIYFGDTGGMFHVVTPDGNKKWKVAKLGDQINTSAAIGNDGTIYVAANTAGVGKLYALKTNATGLQTGGWPMFAKDTKHSGK